MQETYKNKGFTLVELLAVIVILAVILAVAIPSISSVIDNSEKSSFVSSTKLLINAVKIKLLEDETFDITTINKSNLKSILNISDDNYSSISFRYDINGKIYSNIEGQGKWDNLVTNGNYENIEVSNNIVKNGLILNLDAANPSSYPGSGNTWYDLSVNNSNGTLVNGVKYDINNGGSISFDGINDYINLGNILDITAIQSQTYEIWYKTTSTSNLAFLSKNKYTSPWTGWLLEIFSEGKFRYQVFNGNHSADRLGKIWNIANLSDGNWHNIIVVKNDNISSNLKLYFDGNEITNVNTTYYTLTSNISTTTNMEIGGRDGANQCFNGFISSVKIYNRALSKTEIEQNFNALKGRYGL